MRKYLVAVGVVVVLAIPADGSSGAALEKGMGVGCPEGQQGTFAFTVNQTRLRSTGQSRPPFERRRVDRRPDIRDQEDKGVLRQRVRQPAERELATRRQAHSQSLLVLPTRLS